MMKAPLLSKWKNRALWLRLGAAVLLICFAWPAGGLCGALRNREKDILFQWACVAMASREGEPRHEKVLQRTRLQAGDQVKMYFQLKTRSAIYVIHQNAGGELKLLFPLRFFGPDSEANTGQPYYIPGGDAWLMLNDDAGKESIFLIVATNRLVHLEELLGEHAVSDGEKKTALAKDVLEEIQMLRRKHRDLSASAERPITMAGRVRGMRDPQESAHPDVALLADEISATAFFSRTISIEHN